MVLIELSYGDLSNVNKFSLSVAIIFHCLKEIVLISFPKFILKSDKGTRTPIGRKQKQCLTGLFVINIHVDFHQKNQFLHI